MKKGFFSDIQVCVRILKEPYDEQYQECLSTVGNNEIQFKFETKLSSVSKNVVFQKRDKLVHSPEATRDPEKAEELPISSQSQEISQKEVVQNNLQKMIEQTGYQIYRFDKVFHPKNTDNEIFQDLLEKCSSNLLKKRKNLVLFNLMKSNTILNLQMDEQLLKSKSLKDLAKEDLKVGILPILLDHILINQSQTISSPSKLFEKTAIFDTISLSAYIAAGNKFYNLSVADNKGYNSLKDIKPVVVSGIKNLQPILSNLKNHIISKKMPAEFVCYKIKMHDSKSKSKGMSSKIIIFDFLNPFEKVTEKNEKDDKDPLKPENVIESLNQPLKVISSLLSNEKNTSLLKDKFFANLSKTLKYNSKVCLIGNLRPIHPLYHQTLNVIQLLNHIKTNNSNFDTLFNRMVYSQFKKLKIERELKITEVSDTNKNSMIEEANSTFDNAKDVEFLREKSIQLEEENKKISAELNQKLNENKELAASVTQLREELDFLKTKTARYIKDMNESHQKEKENLLAIQYELENRLKMMPQKGLDESMIVQSPAPLDKTFQDETFQETTYKILPLNRLSDASSMDKYREELNRYKQDLEHLSKEFLKVRNENHALRKDKHSRETILLQLLSQVQDHVEKEKKSKYQVIERLQTTLTMKASLFENKAEILENCNQFLKQINWILVSKVHDVMRYSEKNTDVKAQVLVEMNQKFKDIKAKMLRKLNAKNEEIQKYATFFDDLEKRLGNIEKEQL